VVREGEEKGRRREQERPTRRKGGEDLLLSHTDKSTGRKDSRGRERREVNRRTKAERDRAKQEGQMEVP
jgi:hypothetical protein